MQKPNILLEGVLNQIENRVKEDINSDFLAKNIGISSVHLQRLFKFAFKKPLGSYICTRKLTVSLESLLNTGSSLLNIELEYGFGYEQSYIRAFK
jgi:AraC family transcriptional regulator